MSVMHAGGAPQRLIVAITGATGAIYGVRLLQVLRDVSGVETHLLISPAGIMNLQHELDIGRAEVEALADVVHNVRDVGATIASGSFRAQAMIVAPCSMRTLAAIAHGLSDNLITRAADVTLKERRKLVLMVRETPLNLAHLRNMTAVTEMGGIIFRRFPAFIKSRSRSPNWSTTRSGACSIWWICAISVKRWRRAGPG